MELAFCGLQCENCDAYIATQENDNEKRKEVSVKWSKMFGVEIMAKDINCNGCHSNTLIGHCKVCNIRKCGLEKELSTCGECNDYSCDKLKMIHNHDAQAKARLDKISGL